MIGSLFFISNVILYKRIDLLYTYKIIPYSISEKAKQDVGEK